MRAIFLAALFASGCHTKPDEKPRLPRTALGDLQFTSIANWSRTCDGPLELEYWCNEHTYKLVDDWSCRDYAAQYVATCRSPIRWTVSAIQDGRINFVCFRDHPKLLLGESRELLHQLGLTDDAVNQAMAVLPFRTGLFTHSNLEVLRGPTSDGLEVEVCWRATTDLFPLEQP